MNFKFTLRLMALFLSLLFLQGCSKDRSSSPLSNDNAVTNSSENETFSLSPSASLELYGRIESVDVENNSLTIVGISTLISVLENAEIVRKGSGDDVPITLSDIMPGDSVEARGTMAAGDTLLADRIRIREDDFPENEVYFDGRVESIDLSTRIILLVGNPQPITVDQNAEIVSKNGGSEIPILLSDIMPGDSVEIRTNLLPDGTFLANRVRVRTGGDDFASELRFKDTITMIDYEAKIIFFDSLPEVLLVDENTFIYMNSDVGSKNSGSFALSGGGDDDDDDDDDIADTTKIRIELIDLKAGDFVEVHANRIHADTLYAVAIEIEDEVIDNRNEVEFKDFIATINYETGAITFENSTMVGTVLEGALLIGLMDEALAITDFVVGDIVEVRGFRTSDTSFDITRMEKENNL